MKLTNYISFLIFFLIGITVYAQPGKVPKEKIDGKEYYIHTVESGSTLYGISKMYGVTVQDITNANPETNSGLKAGEKIKIPVISGITTNTNTLHENDTPENSEYITHTVKRGETVSGIAREHNVSVADIYNLNPGADQTIREGQILKIKKKNSTTHTSTSNNNVTNNNTDVINSDKKVSYSHVVSRGETFYALSKRFHISEDSIKLLNDGLPEGLKTGDTLKLMISEKLAIKFQNTIAASQNNSDDTTRHSSGKMIMNLFANEKKERYEVALLLPFFLDKNQLKLEKISSTDEQLTYLFEPTRQSLDFYNGVLLAMDSLRQAGLNVKLHVYDTYNDTSRIGSITRLPEFANLDLIIGPTDHIESVAKKAKAYGIPLVCPFSYTNKILFNNPYVTKATTSLSVIINEASEHIVKNHADDPIFIFNGKDKKDDAAADAYQKVIIRKLTENGKSSSNVRYEKMEGSSIKHLVTSFSKTKMNVLVVPSNDVVYVSTLLNNINNLTNAWNGKDYQFTIYGTDEWIKMEDVDINYKIKFNVHVPSPAYVSFTDSSTVHGLIKPFRKKYGIDPDRYAMIGFDLGYFFMAGYLTEGKSFINRLEYYDVELISSRFRFKQVAEGSGYLNSNVYILEYENYELIKRN